MTVSETIFELAGMFETLRETGVRMGAPEVHWLFLQLTALGNQAKANEAHHRWACAQIQDLNREIQETGGAPDGEMDSFSLFTPSFAPKFTTIQGGKAS